MVRVLLTDEVKARLIAALRAADVREVGGVLMAEHTGTDTFTVNDVTIHRRGGIAAFMRRLGEAVGGLTRYFNRTRHAYARFNYLGEWHSHPLFSPEPSAQDDASMRNIVTDPTVGANFVILLVLKIDAAGEFTGSAHAYLPDGSKHRAQLVQNGEVDVH